MTPWQLSLIAIQATLAALAADPNIPKDILGYIQIGLDATTQGVAAVQQAQKAVDPTQLKPIDTTGL